MVKKLLVVLGPTATGKTDLALKLAAHLNGELVSFDSRQVYRGMDIGTGKDLSPGAGFRLWQKKDDLTLGYYSLSGSKIWLYGLCSPATSLDAVRFAQAGRLVIAKIWQANKLPILVGGTGFYLKALLDGFSSAGVCANPSLRRRLEKLSLSSLQKKLASVNPSRFEQLNPSDRANPRRLIRAVEIALSPPAVGLPPLEVNRLRLLGLSASREFLYDRIDARVQARLDAGLLAEIKELLTKYPWEKSVLGTTLAYRQFRPFFENKISLEEAVVAWRFAEHAYLRRQLTWFKKMKNVLWFDLQSPAFPQSVLSSLADF